MRIGGFQKLTLVDYPAKLAASVFTQGCNFRCGYCHNPELVLPSMFQVPIEAEMVLSYLNERRGKLEGVVITGGEPTIQKGLTNFVLQIKNMGFAVKLDTNGSHPDILASLIELKLIDYIAMDIKSSLARYKDITGSDGIVLKILESVELIINSGIPYQFRTTLVKEYCSHEDLRDIQQLIGKAKHYVLQPFVLPQKRVDFREVLLSQYTHAEMELLKAKYEHQG